MTRLRPAFGALLDQLAPLPKCFLEARTLRARMRQGADAPLGDDAVYLRLELSDLKESHRAALALRDQLQRRAQGYLMGVTVASSFCLGALSLLAKARPGQVPPIHPSISARLLLLAVLASFLMSAVGALLALGPSEAYDVWLRAQLPDDPDQKKANLIRFIQLNEAYAMAYASYARASYIGMRNGILLLFAGFTAAILAPGLLL